MKNYNESFETKKDDMHISVSSNYQENCVIIGIDVGVDGFYAENEVHVSGRNVKPTNL